MVDVVEEQPPPPVRKQHRLAEGHVFNTTNGQMHSHDDQPAVVYGDGTRWWYRDGKIHRDGAPAVILSNGVQEYWQNNQRHRGDGPAVVYPATTAIRPQLRGVRQWWHNGKLIKEEVPPNVARYRQMLEQARKACFGGVS